MFIVNKWLVRRWLPMYHVQVGGVCTSHACNKKRDWCLPTAEQGSPPLLPLPGPLLSSSPWTSTSGTGNTGNGSSVSCRWCMTSLLDRHMSGPCALSAWRTPCTLHNCRHISISTDNWLQHTHMTCCTLNKQKFQEKWHLQDLLFCVWLSKLVKIQNVLNNAHGIHTKWSVCQTQNWKVSGTNTTPSRKITWICLPSC